MVHVARLTFWAGNRRESGFDENNSDQWFIRFQNMISRARLIPRFVHGPYLRTLPIVIECIQTTGTPLGLLV